MKNLQLALVALVLTGSLTKDIMASDSYISNTYPDRGFYGSLSYLYWEEKVKSKDEYSQNNLSQEYKLGYMGNIYSPKLLDYTLEGIYKFEKLENEGETVTYTTNSDSKDYRVNFKFIKNSNFPFNIYANQTDRPVTRIDNSSAYSYLYKTQNTGINGLIKFDLFTIDYNALNTSDISENTEYLQDRKVESYNISLRQKGNTSDIHIRYKHRDEDINREYKATNISDVLYDRTKQINDSVNLSYNLNISEDLKFTSSAGIIKTNYMSFLTEIFDANFNLRWAPKSKHSASISVTGSRTNSTYDSNTSETLHDTFDTININQQYSYKITPAFTFTQSASDYMYKNNSTEGDIKNAWLGLRHNYNKNYTQDTNLRINTSLDGQLTDSDIFTKTNNSNESTTTQRYTFSTKAGVTEQLPSIKSRLKANADYYLTQQSTGDSTQRITSSLSLYSSISSLFRNTITTGISKSDTVQVRYDVNSNSYETEKSTTLTTDITETIESSVRLGIDGDFRLKAGIQFSNNEYDDRSIQRTKPLVDTFLNYRIGRHLQYSGNLHIDKDISYNYTNYSSTSTLTYNVGKTSIVASHRYSLTETDEDTGQYSYGRSKFEIKFVRKF